MTREIDKRQKTTIVARRAILLGLAEIMGGSEKMRKENWTQKLLFILISRRTKNRASCLKNSFDSISDFLFISLFS